jgi:hypothetical protein
LYGTGFASPAEIRLLSLITSRGLLADKADCYLQCCNDKEIFNQVCIDKILYDVDRAIDLYAVGEADYGEPEIRAGAYGFLVRAMLKNKQEKIHHKWENTDVLQPLKDIENTLISDEFLKKFYNQNNLSDWQILIKSELCNQFNREIQDANGSGLRRIVETIAPSCIKLDDIFNKLRSEMNEAIKRIDPHHAKCPAPDVNYPKTVAAGVVSIADALNHRQFLGDEEPIMFRAADMANTDAPMFTVVNQPSEITDDEANMLIVSRLVKDILSVAKEADSEERIAAIDAFKQFADDNAELVTHLHLSENFKKIIEAFNSIPHQSDDAQAQTKSFMALKERCIDLVSVIGLGIKR